ncbi:hypothetical protein JHK84_031671 [Glycine max]|nr:hypothetical protein JHK84_031671 [Glycine max]
MTTLPNGLHIATESTLGAHTAIVSIWIDVGSQFETEETNGTAYFLEHIIRIRYFILVPFFYVLWILLFVYLFAHLVLNFVHLCVKGNIPCGARRSTQEVEVGE